MDQKPIIEINKLETYFGDTCIHQDINLNVMRGEVLIIAGGSGSGKTTLMREILMLQKPHAGSIKLYGHEITTRDRDEMEELQANIGVMFQQGALFTSLTVLENVAFPLKLHTNLSKEFINEIALIKISLVGLPPEAAVKYPAELSGGMIKRAAVARAIALDPELLFLDEPTAGLDPQGASSFDELIIELKSALNLTVIMVTHDLDTMWRVSDRVAFLGEKTLLQVGSMSELAKSKHPIIQNYFSGPRARMAEQSNSLDE